MAGLRITPHLLMHPIPTFGYRIDEGSTRFAFATDNEIAMFTNNTNGSLKDLASWCQDADLLVHDAQYSREEYKTHAGFGHSTYEEALSLAEQSGVQQLAFFHHDPVHSDTDIDALIEEALGNHRQAGGTDVRVGQSDERMQRRPPNVRGQDVEADRAGHVSHDRRRVGPDGGRDLGDRRVGRGDDDKVDAVSGGRSFGQVVAAAEGDQCRPAGVGHGSVQRQAGTTRPDDAQ